jgi:glycine oxidase
MSADVLVVGGGVIGLLTARELARGGARLVLVEMGETGRESSWAGGGIVSPLYPWRYADSLTALAGWSQSVYPDLCEELRQETGVDPELIRSGLLILDREEQDWALSWAGEHGVRMQVIAAPELTAEEPELAIRPESALSMPDVDQVRNPRLARSLHRYLDKRVEIREHEEVAEIRVEDGRVIGVRTRQGEIRADQVIVCTGAWTATLLEELGTRPDIQPVRGQMILFYAKPGQLRHIVLYRDRYVIPRQDGRILIGSTLEHTGFEKATTAEAKEALYRTAVEMFPLLKRTPIENHWAGLRPGSPNGVPYIGAHPNVAGLYFSAGHFRNGLVTGPASARLAADLMLGREPILDPSPYALDAPR